MDLCERTNLTTSVHPFLILWFIGRLSVLQFISFFEVLPSINIVILVVIVQRSNI
jgi:hypothetical protein